MKITGNKNNVALNAYVKGAGGKEGVKGSQAAKKGQSAGKTAKSDKADISQKASTLSKVREAVDAVPEVRVDKVSEIKKAVDGGNYNVRGEKVADAIIKNAIVDSKSS
jgi:negative regulator of flagellin synthesis FlgM